MYCKINAIYSQLTTKTQVLIKDGNSDRVNAAPAPHHAPAERALAAMCNMPELCTTRLKFNTEPHIFERWKLDVIISLMGPAHILLGKLRQLYVTQWRSNGSSTLKMLFQSPIFISLRPSLQSLKLWKKNYGSLSPELRGFVIWTH